MKLNFPTINLKNLKEQNTIVSATSILAVSSGAAQILGLFKNRVLASYFGVSDELAIFYTADRIPSLIYSILVVGALSTVFIPSFTQLLKKNKEEAWKSASAIITLGTLTFGLLSALTVIFAKPIVNTLALGKFSQEQVILGANLMTILVVSQLLLVISSFASSILQSFKHFLAPAIAPIVYNLGMILGIVFFQRQFGIYAPAIGSLIGALFHLIIQIPLLKGINFAFKPSFELKNKNVSEVFVRMPARVLSVTFSQLLSTINNSLAILISSSSVVILKYSSQLQFVPVQLFGISMATALLPVLAEQNDEKDFEKFKKVLITTIHQTLFLVMPASMILIILRLPIVRLVYGASKFPWEATLATSYALAFFSISIFSQATVYLLSRAFYALKDTTTPVKISAIVIILNIALSVFFVKYLKLGVWSIALAYSMTTFIENLLLLTLLSKKVGGFNLNELAIPFIKISYSTLFMGISLYVPLKLMDQIVFDTTKTINLLILTFITTLAGVLSYVFFTTIFKVQEISLLYRLISKFINKKDILSASRNVSTTAGTVSDISE